MQAVWRIAVTAKTFRSHIARCLRDYPNAGEGVITLAGAEHCFMYVVQNDVVEAVIDKNMDEASSPLPRKDRINP